MAQRLYLKYRFGAAGMRRGYYDTGENAIIMWLKTCTIRIAALGERRRCLEERVRLLGVGDRAAMRHLRRRGGGRSPHPL